LKKSNNLFFITLKFGGKLIISLPLSIIITFKIKMNFLKFKSFYKSRKKMEEEKGGSL